MGNSSRRWLVRQHKDPFVQSAKQQGYRARSAFKLIELNQRFGFLKQACCVIDLGAAPGAWSQFLAKQGNKQGTPRIIAVDKLSMPSIAGVDFIQGDFQQQSTLDELHQTLQGQPIDVILSDMAPNMTGIKSVDIDRSMLLVELTVDFALNKLPTGGHLVTKIFQGQGFEAILKRVKQHFQQVLIKKPESSRKESREMYLLALQRKAAVQFDPETC